MPPKKADTISEEEPGPVEFHKNLPEERIHPISQLKSIFKAINNLDKYKRLTSPSKTIDEIFDQSQNKYWGTIRYRHIESRPSGDFEVELTLNYSPWLYKDREVLIEGRLFGEKLQNISDEYFNKVNLSEYFVYLENQKEYHISKPRRNYRNEKDTKSNRLEFVSHIDIKTDNLEAAYFDEF